MSTESETTAQIVDTVVFAIAVVGLFAIPVTYLLGYSTVSNVIALIAVHAVLFERWWFDD